MCECKGFNDYNVVVAMYIFLHLLVGHWWMALQKLGVLCKSGLTYRVEIYVGGLLGLRDPHQ